MDPPPPPVRSKRRKPPRKTLSSGNVIRGFVPSSRERAPSSTTGAVVADPVVTGRRGVPPVPPRSGRARALESRRSMDEMMEAGSGKSTSISRPVSFRRHESSDDEEWSGDDGGGEDEETSIHNGEGEEDVGRIGSDESLNTSYGAPDDVHNDFDQGYRRRRLSDDVVDDDDDWASEDSDQTLDQPAADRAYSSSPAVTSQDAQDRRGQQLKTRAAAAAAETLMSRPAVPAKPSKFRPPVPLRERAVPPVPKKPFVTVRSAERIQATPPISPAEPAHQYQTSPRRRSSISKAEAKRAAAEALGGGIGNNLLAEIRLKSAARSAKKPLLSESLSRVARLDATTTSSSSLPSSTSSLSSSSSSSSYSSPSSSIKTAQAPGGNTIMAEMIAKRNNLEMKASRAIPTNAMVAPKTAPSTTVVSAPSRKTESLTDSKISAPDWRQKVRKAKQDNETKKKSVRNVSSDWRKELKAKKERRMHKQAEAEKAKGPDFVLVQRPTSEPASTSPLPQPKSVLCPNKIDPSSSWKKKKHKNTDVASAVPIAAPTSPRSTFGRAKTGRIDESSADAKTVPAWRRNLKSINKAKNTRKRLPTESSASSATKPRKQSAVLNKNVFEKPKPKTKPKKSAPITSPRSNVPAWRQALKKAPPRDVPKRVPKRVAPKVSVRKPTTHSSAFDPTAGPKIVVHRANANKAPDDESDSDWDCDDDSAPVRQPVSYSRRAAAIKAVKKPVSSSTLGGKPASEALGKPKLKLQPVLIKRPKPKPRQASLSKRVPLGGKSSHNVDDLTRILERLGNYYAGYEDAIRDEGYETIDELRGLELDELVEMGVKKGHAKRIIRAIFEV